jgi:hypothetical protein
MTDLSLFSDGAKLPGWVGQLIDYLGAAYPNWKPQAMTAAVYFDALRDLNPADVRAGAQACVKQGGEFAPTAAAIRAQAKKAKAYRHPAGCGCFDCAGKLPESERWERLDDNLKAALEDNAPHIAKALKSAAGKALEEGGKRFLAAKQFVRGDPENPGEGL